MKLRLLASIAMATCLLWAAGARAQGRPPGGFPPGGGSPGGGAPGGGAPGGHAPGMPPGFPSSSNGSSNTNSGSQPPSIPSLRANVTTNSGLKLGPPGRWWDDKSFVQTIGISHDQQKRMDTIFNANKGAIIDTYKAFQTQQTKLDALTKNPQADKAQIFAAIDSVNEARDALQKANTQMLLQIRQQLSSGQVTKLETLP